MDIKVIQKYLSDQNQPAFRLKQIKDAYFKQNLSGFEEITNLPKDLKVNLTSKFSWLLVKPVQTLGTPEKGAVKALLELPDGLKIETVLMVYRNWLTACLSISVGCPLNCRFCATGQMGFKRNLNASEIVDQIVFWDQYLNKIGENEKIVTLPVKGGIKGGFRKVSRIVFMGMGEPFLNWANTWEAIEIINDPEALNIGQRHITVSTAGIVPGIENFTKLNSQINLAISLHTPFQEKRETIMPIAKKYPLEELMAAAKDYVQKTKRKLFFEYALIEGFNDFPEDVQELKKLLNQSLYHLNLINLNPTEAKFFPVSNDRLAAFLKLLNQSHIPYTLRRSLGSEIQAACGQLAGKE